MGKIIEAGVSVLIADNEVRHLTDAEQDELIKRIAQHLEQEFRNHTMEARVYGDMVFDVQGPFHHPLMGHVHIHNLMGRVDLGDLHPECGAYKAYHSAQNADPTLGGRS